MAEIKIGGKAIDTETLSDRQKRLLALLQESMKTEERLVIELELARAARNDLQNKIDTEIVNKPDD